VAACLLAACAAGFFASDTFVPGKEVVDGLKQWLSTAPAALATIPPDANVWCDEFLTSHLAMRRHVRSLPYATLDPYAQGETFVPERILVSSRWLLLTHHLDMRFLAPLTEAGLVPILANSDFTVFGKPNASPPTAVAQTKVPDTAQAKNSLGSEYMARGDLSEAVKWFLDAATAGNAQAQYNLGVAYTLGRGVAQDVPAAVGWFRRSAEQNYPPAQYNLGVCLADSDPPIRNRTEAQWWLAKASQSGYKNAEKKLAEVRRRDRAGP